METRLLVRTAGSAIEVTPREIEDITRWREDMNFIFEW